MRRRLFNFAAAVSLLLCIGSGVLWVRSYFVAESVDNYRYDSQLFFGTTSRLQAYGVCICRGRVRVLACVQSRASTGYPRGSIGWHYKAYDPEDVALDPLNPDEIDWMGFVVLSYLHGYSAFNTRMVIVPFWMILAIFASVPLFWIRQWLTRRRTAPCSHECRNCGYNLTGNTSGVCPECGTAISATERTDARESCEK